MNETSTYVINRIEKNHNIVVLNITPKEGDIFDFKPGQFVMLAIYNKKENIWRQRPFSICSSPLNKKYLQLAIKVYGEFTQKIAILKKGDHVGISGPYGFFTFNESKMKKVVFIAGGIGITPFISAIRYVSEKELPNEITLLYSNKTGKDVIFLKELKSISRKCKNIQVIFILTNDNSARFKYEKGRIDKAMIEKYCLSHREKLFSLCGPLKFMKSMMSYLEEIEVSEDHIKMERFK